MNSCHLDEAFEPTVVLMSFGMGINYFQQFVPLYCLLRRVRSIFETSCDCIENTPVNAELGPLQVTRAAGCEWTPFK